MPGFTSRDDIINEMSTNGKQQVWQFSKTGATAPVVGIWHSLWKATGYPPAGADPATTPGTAYASDTASPVAGSMYNADVSTDLRFLMSFGAVSQVAGTLLLYDRLAGVSGLLSTTTGNKTVSSSALDHYSGTAAVNNEVWLEWTTAATVTAPVFTLNSYTSADGTTAQTGAATAAIPVANAAINCMTPLPMSGTKQGVRSIESGINVGTASTAGTFTALIIRRLAAIPLVANQWNEVSLLDDMLSLPRIYDNATLGLMWLGTTTTAPVITGAVTCAYG
jgi:hypothetical protein